MTRLIDYILRIHYLFRKLKESLTRKNNNNYLFMYSAKYVIRHYIEITCIIGRQKGIVRASGSSNENHYHGPSSTTKSHQSLLCIVWRMGWRAGLDGVMLVARNDQRWLSEQFFYPHKREPVKRSHCPLREQTDMGHGLVTTRDRYRYSIYQIYRYFLSICLTDILRHYFKPL